LTAEETRDFLSPALDALVYLHAKGLVHGHLKPSNLLATQDCLKLSSDTLLSVGEKAELRRSGDIFDAPELPAAPLSPKADAWSLGATLVAALTQQPPLLAPQQTGDPVIPDSLPEPFREIARRALRRSEHQRWSVGEIAARLNPAPMAAAAAVAPAAALSPLSVPLATEPAVPLSKLPSVAEAPVRRSTAPAKTRKSSPFGYFVPALLGAAVVIGLIIAIPKMFHFQGQTASSSETAASTTPARPVASAPADPAPAKVNREETPSKPAVKTEAAASLSPASAVLRTDSASPARAKHADEVAGRGQILEQVLPKPAAKAMATITGTIRVVVKVQVDAAGNVSEAGLDSPGPSKYFADLSEKAARKWQFAGAESDGHGIPSEWLIRFEFTPSGVQAFPQQTAP
jgi:TonB family protein